MRRCICEDAIDPVTKARGHLTVFLRLRIPQCVHRQLYGDCLWGDKSLIRSESLKQISFTVEVKQWYLLKKKKNLRKSFQRPSIRAGGVDPWLIPCLACLRLHSPFSKSKKPIHEIKPTESKIRNPKDMLADNWYSKHFIYRSIIYV